MVGRKTQDSVRREPFRPRNTTRLTEADSAPFYIITDYFRPVKREACKIFGIRSIFG